MWGLLQTNSRKSCCRGCESNKQLLAQTPPPPLRGRGQAGADAPVATFGAHLCAVRIWIFRYREKSKFVASTAKRQRGLQRGKPGSPLPCFASFCRSKRKAPAASGANYAFAKGSAPPIGDHKLSPAGQAHSLGLCKRPRPAGRRNENMPRQKDRKKLLPQRDRSFICGGKCGSIRRLSLLCRNASSGCRRRYGREYRLQLPLLV